MINYRLAVPEDLDHLKEIWKLCFGDPDPFINLYYSKRYLENDILLLLKNGTIAAMLTIIPVKMRTPPTKDDFTLGMFYAIATHPQYQHQGLATKLTAYSNQYLASMNQTASILVPGDKGLFEFYRKQGYADAFCVRELLLTREQLNNLAARGDFQSTLSPLTPQKYNQRRNSQLQDHSFIAYADQEITYQKELSLFSGADLYGIHLVGMKNEIIQGCMTVERVNDDKIIIKELLLPDHVLAIALKEIAEILPANEYLIRMPVFIGSSLGGNLRPMGMIKANNDANTILTFKQTSYLGLAFD